MKTYITYIIVLVAGLFLGWLLFGGGSNTNTSHDHETMADNQMWTCSMHPQIMQPEAGDCPICGMDLIPAASDADGLAPNQFKMSDKALALANVETTVIGDTAENNGILNLSGKLTINDNASAIQAAHFGGRIEKLYFKSEGEFVKNGALIASIYSPELVTAQNELIEALDIKESQPELYKAVRNKLKYWKITEAQILELERTKKVITNFNKYSNTSGVIQKVYIEEGNHVMEGAPLFDVSNLSTLWASLDVYEQDIKHLKEGQSIQINVNAFPDTPIETTIDYIDPTLNTTTRTVTVRATLKNTDNRLKPGMLVSAKLNTTGNTKQKALSVPRSAVMWTGKRSVVYVKVSRDAPIFEMREIEIESAIGDQYEVLSGLEQGEEVVTNGTFTIDAAAQLLGKNSMMSRPDDMMEHEESKTEIIRYEVPEEFQLQLRNVFDTYIELKNALVLSNNELATKSSEMFIKNLENVDMTLLKVQEAHKHWMQQLKGIDEAIKMLSQHNDINMQRKYFKPLSAHMTSAVVAFGVNQKIYSQYCPMADNDNGGYWLSLEEGIRNPYFGDAMLKCGTVEQIIE